LAVPQHTNENRTFSGSVTVWTALQVAPTALPMMYFTLSWNTSLLAAVAASAASALWS
jgi:hypothetical protein